MNEIWKPVIEYEGYYEISNLGNVRSVDRIIIDINGVSRNYKSKQLKTCLNENGYVVTTVRINNVHHNFKIHILVAMAFIPNLENKLTVNHNDGNKQNNNDWNLEWATHGENIKHAYEHNLNNCESQYKPVLQYSKAGEFICKHESISAAKKFLNITGGHIGEVCDGKMKSAYGYVWKFI